MTLGVLFTRTAPVGTLMRRLMILMGIIGFAVGFVLVAPLVPDQMIRVRTY